MEISKPLQEELKKIQDRLVVAITDHHVSTPSDLLLFFSTIIFYFYELENGNDFLHII